MQVLPVTLQGGRRPADDEIGKPVAGDLAVESERSVSLEIAEAVETEVYPAATHGNLVTSTNDGEVFSNLVVIGNEITGRTIRTGQDKAARYVDIQPVRYRREDVRAKFAQGRHASRQVSHDTR